MSHPMMKRPGLDAHGLPRALQVSGGPWRSVFHGHFGFPTMIHWPHRPEPATMICSCAVFLS